MNDIAIIEREADLISAPDSVALKVFTEPNAIDPLLDHIKSEILHFKSDVSTAKGRKEIASMAYKVARSKTAIDEVGKKLTTEQKKIPALIDATRKRVRDLLDQLRDDVRAPLDEWESAEAARVESHKALIQHIINCGDGFINGEPQPFGLLFAELDQIEIGANLEEFEAEAHRAKEDARSKLKKASDEHQRQEAERAELERLRAAEEARKAKERDEQIARQAAEQAKAKAEHEAQERAKAVEAEALRTAQAAMLREAELKLAAEQAERRAVEAEAKAKREAQEKADREAAEIAKREADIEHRRAIARDAVRSLIDAGIAASTAIAVVSLIAEQKVQHVIIRY